MHPSTARESLLSMLVAEARGDTDPTPSEVEIPMSDRLRAVLP